jgi:hypothetical protein
LSGLHFLSASEFGSPKGISKKVCGLDQDVTVTERGSYLDPRWSKE